MVLGIDLGTTYSAAAYLDENGEPQIVKNAEGNKSTPSVVMIDKDKVLVGEEAKKKSFGWLGKVFSRIKAQIGIKGFFKKEKQETEYSPEELSAYILKKVAQDAAGKLDEEITGVVVTFPANFQDNQRKATQDAIRAAGLNEIGMINEPTAAALYFCHKTCIDKGTILVYDLGGGTFDATLMAVEGNSIEVLATAGDNTVGGVYFDDAIVGYVAEQVLENYGVDLDEERYRNVRAGVCAAAEDCKKALSESEQASIFVNIEGKKREVVITRETFESLIQSVCMGTESTIKKMMKQNGFSPEDIDRVFLTGGSSRIPYVKERLEKLFARELFYEEDTDNAVALGAALYGGICVQEEASALHFSDVCSHGVGVLLYDGDEKYNEVLIAPNSKIPATATYRCQTRVQDQSRIFLTVTQGESREAEYVNAISEIKIELPGKFPAGTLVNVGISLDEKQMVHVYLDIPAADVKKEYDLKRLSNLSEKELQGVVKAVAEKSIVTEKAVVIDSKKVEGKKEKKSIFDVLKKPKRAERIVKDAVNAYFGGVVGMKEIKTELSVLYTSYEMNKGAGGSAFQWNFLIGGEKGNGKSMLADILAKMLYDLHYTSRKEPVKISAVQLLSNPEMLLGEEGEKCAIVVTDAEKLVGSGETENKGDKDNIWMLIEAYLEEAVRSKNTFYIFTGEKAAMEKLIKENEKLTAYYMTYLEIPSYTTDELCQIGRGMIQNDGYSLTPEAKMKFFRLIKSESVRGDFANMHSLKNLLNGIYRNVVARCSRSGSMEKTLREEDLLLDSNEEETLEELLEQLDNLPGLAKVKEEVRRKVDYFQYCENLRKNGEIPEENEEAITLHTLLLGSPGTGKTTVARLIGKIYGSLGILPRSDIFNEVTRADLVAEYQGQTAPKVEKAVKEAMGGILFLDEAYALVNAGNGGDDSFGKEALAQLLKCAEDYRDRFMIIMAGYEKEMDEFMRANSGMYRRFPNRLHFEDYNEEELYEIFCYMAKKNRYTLAEDAVETVKQLIGKKRNLKGYENAGGVRNIYEALKQAVASRVIEAEGEKGGGLREITRADVEKILDDTGREKEKTVEDYLAELDAMIGLASVKKKVREILVNADMARVMSMRNGKPVSMGSLHMIFEGGAGTGKTTVARLLGKILALKGILPSGEFVEVSRKNLVAGYQGQTAQKTMELVERAKGGVLFIDEAYAIVSGENDSFGKEALDTLIAPIENNRNDMMVIMAGYPDKMAEMMKANEGLQSRMKTVVSFEDYSLDEMVEIFCHITKEKNYRIEDGLEPAIRKYISREKRKKGDFGNARGVRNCVENVIGRHNMRVYEENPDIEALSDEELYTITKEDLENLEG